MLILDRIQDPLVFLCLVIIEPIIAPVWKKNKLLFNRAEEETFQNE